MTETERAGLRFLSPQYGSATPAPSRSALQNWGAKLNNPEFTTAEGFAERTKDLDIVAEESVYDAKGQKLDGFKRLFSTKSGQTYEVVTERYKLMQDREIILPVSMFLREATEGKRLSAIGRFDGVGSGSTTGHVVIADPEFVVELLREYPDTMMLGVRFWNSYNRESSFGAEIFGVRMVCVNYNLWGTILGKFVQRHMGFNTDEVAKRIRALLDGALENVEALRTKAQNAFETPIVEVVVPDLLWGVNFPIKGIKAFSEPTGLRAYNPDVETHGLNAWTLYNAATAYLTWGRKETGLSLKMLESRTRQAADLLDVDEHDKLIERGEERKRTYAETLAKMAKAREEARIEVRKVA